MKNKLYSYDEIYIAYELQFDEKEKIGDKINSLKCKLEKNRV